MPKRQVSCSGIFAALAILARVGVVSELAGLRERKKAATRVALSEAAIRLAVVHGLDQVTTDAIAAEADVAPRTFRNYFASKEEAVLAQVAQQARAFADLIRARPAGEPVWDSVRAASVTVFNGLIGELAKMRQRHELIASSPTLAVQFLAVCEETERLIAEAIAERVGVDVHSDPYPRLQAGVAVLALKSAMESWHQDPDAVELPELAGQAIDLVRAGLPQPSRDATPGG
jgi:AcrR family transcriptional regulator